VRNDLFFQLDWLDYSSITVSMNQLPNEKRVQVVTALVEGCSIRSTVPMSGVAKSTVVNLPVEVGAACAKNQHEKLSMQEYRIERGVLPLVAVLVLSSASVAAGS